MSWMVAEDATNELPAGVRKIVEARTGDAVFVIAPDYRVVYWDEKAEEITGLLSRDVLGRRCYEVVMGEREGGAPFCTYGCSVMHLAQAGRPVSSYDMRITTRSGQKRWVNVSNLSVDSEEGPYLVHLLRDSQGAHDALEMARGLIRLSSKKEAAGPGRRDIPTLTPRQLDVLQLISRGKTVREISQELYLSEATVRNHVGAVLRALDAHSQLEAVARARELGLLPD
ncbi:transcriptional regulator, LuxR family [Rubrobacter xylanophilus DSM 9941]|uniref:Transcriptional regulator, LuxR family n=2 Tax=Rubrobacter xylanophilus TaxID=49319 RepID=Q1ARI5_RUBXD|nr:transcriptional regulator, LuxR family [Rubrobacter xylanophilus DSM 9941]